MEIELIEKYTSKRVPLRIGRKPIVVNEEIVKALEVINEHSEADISSMIEDALGRMGIVAASKKLLEAKSAVGDGQTDSSQNSGTKASLSVAPSVAE